MAGNQSLAGALLASVLIHASILSAPIQPFGWMAYHHHRLDVSLPPLLAVENREPPATDRVQQAAPVEDSRPTDYNRSHEQAVPIDLPEGRGSDPAVVISVVTVPAYLRANELTRRPVLKRPVLREDPGRLYPVSDSLLLVRINESGQVDDVVLVATNHSEMAAQAIQAFRLAEYFPGMVGSDPAKAELVIQVRSSGNSILVVH